MTTPPREVARSLIVLRDRMTLAPPADPLGELMRGMIGGAVEAQVPSLAALGLRYGGGGRRTLPSGWVISGSTPALGQAIALQLEGPGNRAFVVSLKVRPDQDAESGYALEQASAHAKQVMRVSSSYDWAWTLPQPEVMPPDRDFADLHLRKPQPEDILSLAILGEALREAGHGERLAQRADSVVLGATGLSLAGALAVAEDGGVPGLACERLVDAWRAIDAKLQASREAASFEGPQP